VSTGQALTTDILPHVDALVIRHRPKVIVYYCGTNDISLGLSAHHAADGFAAFAKLVRAALPDVKLVYVSVSLTPFQMYMHNRDKLVLVNQIVRSSVDRCGYVDLLAEPRFSHDFSLYVNDGHHLNDEGHRLLASMIKHALSS